MIVGYSFEFSYQSCYETALKHLTHLDVVEKIKEVCRLNDSTSGAYSLMPMIEFANEVIRHKDHVKDLIVKNFRMLGGTQRMAAESSLPGSQLIKVSFTRLERLE